MRKIKDSQHGAAWDGLEFGSGLVLQGVRKSFGRNEEIFGEGEPADHVYRVVSGAVRLQRFTQDGRRQILSFHFPGDVFGLERNACHSVSAECVSDAEVMLVRRSQLEHAAANNLGAAQALTILLADSLDSAHEHALILGRRGAGERVAAFLIALSTRLPAGEALDLPMSRADIADYLALTIESVSRAFTEMERQSTIALPTSRHVVMRNRSALNQLQAA